MYNIVTKAQVLFSVMLCIGMIATAQSDTTSVYYKLNVPYLDNKAKHTIDSLVYYDIITSYDELLIIGYADYIGTNEYNDTLSGNRASHVKQYLLNMGMKEENITLCVGKGEVPRDIELPEGYQSDRRVDIVKLTKHKKAAPPVKEDKPELPPLKHMPSSEALKFSKGSTIEPQNIRVGMLMVLDRIFFYTGRHVVVPESVPELDKLYNFMEENPTLKINIEGHVCCVHPSVDAIDEDTHEIALSVNRAKFIYKYLISKGIDKSRLSYQGFGKTRPLRVHEFTQEDQDMNKRVEIRVLSK